VATGMAAVAFAFFEPDPEVEWAPERWALIRQASASLSASPSGRRPKKANTSEEQTQEGRSPMGSVKRAAAEVLANKRVAVTGVLPALRGTAPTPCTSACANGATTCSR
jgi:hypothetical protein